MIINRKKNAINGTLSGVVLKILQIIFPFAIRTIFINTLGIQYLGLNSLFTAVLQVLNLAELGVSSALVFSMYKPIAEDDKEKMCQLMNLYRLYYRVIGLVIFVVGLVLIPFIPKLIKGTVPSDINIYIIYLMNLSATVLSYWLFAYRNSLFTAHQRNDVISIITICVNLVMYAVQIAMLVVFRNYYLYLTINISGQVLINIVTAIASKKYFPEYGPKGILPIEEHKIISKKVRDLFTAKIGAVINNSADSLVISSFLGLELLAVYQNYYYIISALMAMFNIFFAACNAGIGNSLVVRKEEDNRKLLYNINYIVFIAINFCCCCLVNLYQPFMQKWVGQDYMLNFSFVILFAVYLYAEEAPRTLIVFKDAGGIWKEDRFRPLLSAGVNLILNLILTQYIGLYGIILSTIFALMFVSYPWLIMNINKRLFPIGIKKYITRIICYSMVIAMNVLITYTICRHILFGNVWLTLVIRLLLCTVIANISFILVFFKTDENKYVLEMKEALKKKVKIRR